MTKTVTLTKLDPFAWLHLDASAHLSGKEKIRAEHAESAVWLTIADEVGATVTLFFKDTKSVDALERELDLVRTFIEHQRAAA